MGRRLMTVTAKERLGRTGEDLAAGYLTQLGFRVLARRHACRFGEIDLVAEEGDCLCFVEVRTRRPGPVRPFESVGVRKQRRIAAAALDYLASVGVAAVGERALRFDVVEVNMAAEGSAEVILCRNAFDAPD
jgi:putative endonuclease